MRRRRRDVTPVEPRSPLRVEAQALRVRRGRARERVPRGGPLAAAAARAGRRARRATCAGAPSSRRQPCPPRKPSSTAGGVSPRGRHLLEEGTAEADPTGRMSPSGGRPRCSTRIAAPPRARRRRRPPEAPRRDFCANEAVDRGVALRRQGACISTCRRRRPACRRSSTASRRATTYAEALL